MLRSHYHFQVYRLENMEEPEHTGLKEKIAIVILNPAQIQNNTRHFVQLKRTITQFKWIGLIYSYFDKEILSVSGSLLHITDTPETIISTIYKQVHNAAHVSENTVSEQITEREMEVLIQLVHGLSDKEIGEKLNISIHTVVSHRKNIIQKTGIKSQAGLTIYAISNKIISIDSYTD